VIDTFRNMAGRILDIGRSVGYNRIHLLIQSGIRGPASPNKTYQCHAYHRDIARLISAWRRNRFIRHHKDRSVSAKPRRIALRNGNIYYPRLLWPAHSQIEPIPRGIIQVLREISAVKTKIVCNKVFYIILMNFLIKYGIRRFFDPSFSPISQYH